MIRIPTTELRETDRIIMLDDHNKVREIVELKTEIPTLGCLGRHFICKDGNLVCYGTGKVFIMER